MYLVVEPAVEEDRISVLVGHLPVGGDHLVVVVDPLLEVMVPEVYLYCSTTRYILPNKYCNITY
jgi:hypothetical protein